MPRFYTFLMLRMPPFLKLLKVIAKFIVSRLLLSNIIYNTGSEEGEMSLKWRGMGKNFSVSDCTGKIGPYQPELNGDLEVASFNLIFHSLSSLFFEFLFILIRNVIDMRLS